MRSMPDTRSIPADAIIVRQNWLRAYEFTTDRGAAALNDYRRGAIIESKPLEVSDLLVCGECTPTEAFAFIKSDLR